MADELVIEIADLPEPARDKLLGALLARFDEELGVEVAALLRKWADQTERYERDGSVNPRGARTAADYRRVADAIDEHRAHLASGL